MERVAKSLQPSWIYQSYIFIYHFVFQSICKTVKLRYGLSPKSHQEIGVMVVIYPQTLSICNDFCLSSDLLVNSKEKSFQGILRVVSGYYPLQSILILKASREEIGLCSWNSGVCLFFFFQRTRDPEKRSNASFQNTSRKKHHVQEPLSSTKCSLLKKRIEWKKAQRFSKNISKGEMGSVTEHQMTERWEMPPARRKTKKVECKCKFPKEGLVYTTLGPSERRVRAGFWQFP